MLPNQLSLVDGTIVKLCPTDKPLYCSQQGKFYSLHNAILTEDGWMLHEVQPSYAPIRRKKWRSSNGISGSQYPIMRHFGCINCHILMALTWIGPRPLYQTPDGRKLPMEIDHLNGDKMNWSLDNLQYVTPSENRKRARLLQVLRSIGRNPLHMSREELLEIFNKYTFVKH